MVHQVLRKLLPSRARPLVAGVIAGSFAGSVIRRVIGSTIRHRGTRIRINHPRVSNRMVGALFWQLYERAEADQIRKFLPGDSDVLELGASSGVNTVQIAARLAAGRRLVSVEADPELSSLAVENCRSNSFQDKVTVISAALSYEGSEVPFQRHREPIGGSVRPVAVATNMISVPAVTLAQLTARFGLRRYTLVMDIEGTEWQILQHPGELEGCRRIIAELHDVEEGGRTVTVGEMIGRFEKLGFGLLHRDGRCVVLDRQLMP
jgi:FkbM family methyltransferase